jgi:hypothetical protein
MLREFHWHPVSNLGGALLWLEDGESHLLLKDSYEKMRLVLLESYPMDIS